MKGLVILDGPDACGKTTLANQLLDGDKAGYVHLTYYPDRELWRVQYFALIKAACRLSMGKLTVIDRHWPSELIYSRAYRDGTRMSSEARGWDRVVKRLCGVYVVCAPLPESAVERHRISCQTRSEMYAPSPTILDVARRYYDWWHGGFPGDNQDYLLQIASNGGMCRRFVSYLYDIVNPTQRDNLRLVCSEIAYRLGVLQDSQYPAALESDQPNFLGHVSDADVLFVGERINPSKTGRWPFIDFGASSAVMSSTLHLLNFDEGRGLWTNAFARDVHAMALLERYPKIKRVVALGEKASCYLASQAVSHVKVFHPSYARRFAKLDRFTSQLNDAIS